MSGSETVGSLLAVVANSVNDAISTLRFADKRAWGSAEFEQLRLLEETLDVAKKDFQELPALVNGRFYYENDRKEESLEELRDLCSRFTQHSQNFRNWARSGGDMDPEWEYKTRWLRRELHRAQCRAVRRIRDDLDATSSRPRCLGALLVWRSQQQQLQPSTTTVQSPQTHDSSPQMQLPPPPTSTVGEIAACNSTGVFQRLGPRNRDIAFVCDFCDGFLVWEDLRSMPSTRQRAASTPQGMSENWAAIGFANPRAKAPSQPHSRTHSRGGTYHSSHDLHDTGIELRTSAEQQQQSTSSSSSTLSPHTAKDSSASTIRITSFPPHTDPPDPMEEPDVEATSESKRILFPPVAIANHLSPEPGDWQASLLCPLCDDHYYEEQGDDDMDRTRYVQDERGFESVAALQEHLEWEHSSLLPTLGGSGADGAGNAGGKCSVM